MSNRFIQGVLDQFDKGKTFSFSDMNPFQDVGSWVSTGSPSLDYFLKTLGYPVGIIEVRGESQSGKTTFSLEAMKSAINAHGDKAVVVVLSSERRDNRPYANALGLDVSQVIIHRVTTIEDVSNKIYQTVEAVDNALEGWAENEVHKNTKKSDPSFKSKVETLMKENDLHFFFVWDSLGQTVSSQELAKAKENAKNNTTNKSALGSAARSLSEFLRSFLSLQDERNTTLMIINRPYDRVDGRPGKKSYGGKAITFFPTMRLELARIQGIKVGDEEVGQITQIKTIKTDFDLPKQKFNVEIAYGKGFVLSKHDIQLGIEAGLLTKHGVGGASFKVGKKELKWTSRKQLYEIYDERPPLLNILIKKLTKYAHDKVIKEHKEKIE